MPRTFKAISDNLVFCQSDVYKDKVNYIRKHARKREMNEDIRKDSLIGRAKGKKNFKKRKKHINCDILDQIYTNKSTNHISIAPHTC